jgi:hypothetical protein
MDEWDEKIGKDEQQFILVYVNDTNYTFKFVEKESVLDGKHTFPPTDSKKKRDIKSLVLEPKYEFFHLTTFLLLKGNLSRWPLKLVKPISVT